MTAPRPRWLSAEEQATWRMFLAACHTLFSTVDGQLMHDSSLPHGYYEILVRLSEAPGHALRMSQLAEASTSSKSRLSHAVARLEERGWVSRLSCPTDRRGQIAQLTDAGLAALTAAAPGHVEQVRRSLIDLLSREQVTQLRQISAAIIAGGCAERAAQLAAADVGGIPLAGDCAAAEGESCDGTDEDGADGTARDGGPEAGETGWTRPGASALR
ncbi:MAG: MarR family winged helix-turn-helix transcriptional regulator [Streptosporangiaceae bacterium]